MAFESYGPPGDYTTFVERRVPGLRAAARLLSGNEQLVDSIVDDLFAAAAGRWRWLRFSEQRLRRRNAADAYLDRIFRREAASWQRGPPPRPGLTGPAPARVAEDAERYWSLGRRIRRRRLIAGGAVGLLLLAMCGMPRNQGPAEEDVLPLVPTSLPPLLDVLPGYAAQERLPVRKTPLPADIGLDVAQSAGYQSAAPGRALAIFHVAGQPYAVVGDDGLVRQLDGVPVATGSTQPPLSAASLSPDGTQVAFLGNDSIVVLDLTTMKSTRYTALRRNTDVAWLTPRTLVVSGGDASLVVDLRTGTTGPTTVNARHVLTGQGGALAPVPSPGTVPASAGLPDDLAERVIELLPTPPRLRTHARSGPEDTIVTGAPWLGPWQSPGYLVAGSAGRAARECLPGSLNLPSRYGTPVLATVVLHPTTGHIQRSLIATPQATGLRSMVLGWLDRDTALIRTGDGRGQHLLGWRVTDGELSFVSAVNRDATVSVADLGRVG